MDQENDSEGSRWKNISYGAYRLVLWASMLNDMSVAFGATEAAHSMFYFHTPIYIITVIFVGIPLAYSEICIAQYSNCGIISIWEYFPLFRGFGYGLVLLLVYKTLYILVLGSWYLRYTFYSAMDPPPWYSCDEFPQCTCMVKRVNKSIFQHCIVAQKVYNADCGVMTASNCFFEREIGEVDTDHSYYCMIPWKSVGAAVTMSIIVYLLTIKRDKFLVIGVKLHLLFVGIIMLTFCSTAFTTGSSWLHPGKSESHLDQVQVFRTSTHAFLSVGTGTGALIMLSRGVPFRSPAIMTAIVTPLLSTFVTAMFALIAFSAIMTTSYYHGEEEKVIEIGDSIFFEQMGSMSELLSYFEPSGVWSFCWFSTMFVCMFINFWLLVLLLSDYLYSNISFVRKYVKLSRFFLILLLIVVTCPFFCSDLAGALADATEIGQLITSLSFSLSIYWIYGYRNHAVDIIFMIGVKSSYFWRITWLINPIVVFFLLVTKFTSLYVDENREFHKRSKDDIQALYVLLALYFFIVFARMITDVIRNLIAGTFKSLFFASELWGPKDKVLYKSRQMFRPEIMTQEFLYRQVRLNSYDKNRTLELKKVDEEAEVGSEESCRVEWSALTSN